jgi:hypothetical protein
MRVACGIRARGFDGDAIYAAMVPLNEAMCEAPISDEDLQTMCHGIERRYPAGEVEPEVIIGGSKAARAEPPAPLECASSHKGELSTFFRWDEFALIHCSG